MVTKNVRKNPATGREEVFYETTRTVVHHWATIFGQVVIIGVMLFGAVRFGVNHQCLDVINAELSAPNGRIHKAMEEHRGACRVDDSIRPMEKQVVLLDAILHETREDVRELKQLMKEHANVNR